jgi:hypothetical protein
MNLISIGQLTDMHCIVVFMTPLALSRIIEPELFLVLAIAIRVLQAFTSLTTFICCLLHHPYLHQHLQFWLQRLLPFPNGIIV